MKLPSAESAHIPATKLTEYLLSTVRGCSGDRGLCAWREVCAGRTTRDTNRFRRVGANCLDYRNRPGSSAVCNGLPDVIQS
jgi:hypothetical protein